MNYLKFMALLSILFLAACSSESEAAAEATEAEAENTETEEMGPPYTEYMTCTPGADFSDATVTAMVDEWNDFEFADGFFMLRVMHLYKVLHSVEKTQFTGNFGGNLKKRLMLDGQLGQQIQRLRLGAQNIHLS